jgi:hypothetical protein
MTYRSPQRVASKIIAALMFGGVTEPKLQKDFGLGSGSTARWLEALHAEGVIRISGYGALSRNNTRPRIYELQTSPFALPDAPKPATRAQVRAAEPSTQPRIKGPRVASIFDLGEALQRGMRVEA